MPVANAPGRPPLEVPLLDSPKARRNALAGSWVAIAGIAIVDWKVQPNVSLGFLYVFPILVLSLFAQRWLIVAVAVLCGVLREIFGPMPWDGDAAARLLMGLAAFLGAGLFVSELARNRRSALEHTTQLQRQSELREQAQEDLRALVESSPAAILTLDAGGAILLANDAAHRLLEVEDGTLRGQSVGPFLPALVSALDRAARPLLRTSMECVGRRRDGEVFLAHVWFSTYRTIEGRRLAAIILDVSEELRDREAQGLGSVVAASRVLFGAVSHEVRNLAAAASVAHTNLARTAHLSEDEDFRALGALVSGLEKIASADLRLGSTAAVDSVDVQGVLDEARIVLEPAFREEGAALSWSIAPGLPRVVAEPHSLLQIFLNLAQNSQRAMVGCREKRLAITASREGEHVVVRFEDTGPGVAQPDLLFRPFQSGVAASGLGLFVSRSIARSFAGDVQYEQRVGGSCFAVRLARSADSAGQV